MSDAITSEDLENLRHMLGAEPGRYPKSRWGFRNRFVLDAIGTDCVDLRSMRRLEAHGYVQRGSGLANNLIYYHATEAGCEAIGLTKAQIKRAMECL